MKTLKSTSFHLYIKTLHPCILYIIANVKAMMKPIHIVEDNQESQLKSKDSGVSNKSHEYHDNNNKKPRHKLL